ncbi:hypothetical protein ACHAWF_002211 [Thalassiosira exigua]
MSDRLQEQAAADERRPERGDGLDSSFFRVFGDILQGFRDKRHYDGREVDSGHVSEASVRAAVTSPLVPLAPEVELRHRALQFPSRDSGVEILQGFRGKRHYDGKEVGSGQCHDSETSVRSLTPSPEPLAPEIQLRHDVKANNFSRGLPDALQPDEGAQIREGIAPRQRASVCSPATSEGGVHDDARKERHAKVDKAPSQQPVPHLVAASSPAASSNGSPTPSSSNGSPAPSNTEMARTAEKPKPQKKRGTKRKEEPQPPVNPGGETTQVVGMGFFSQLQDSDLYGQVVGTTGVNKRKRRRKKPDPLAGVSMGFFSGQMNATTTTESSLTKELSERIEPLYDWAPALDERLRSAGELGLPVLLPTVAIMGTYTGFAWWYCMSLPVVHTVETLLTNFGPKAAGLHLGFSPITPFVHMCIDLLILIPINIIALVWPGGGFGEYAFVHGTFFLILEYIYWSFAYKAIVMQRKEAKLKRHYALVKS